MVKFSTLRVTYSQSVMPKRAGSEIMKCNNIQMKKRKKIYNENCPSSSVHSSYYNLNTSSSTSSADPKKFIVPITRHQAPPLHQVSEDTYDLVDQSSYFSKSASMCPSNNHLKPSKHGVLSSKQSTLSPKQSVLAPKQSVPTSRPSVPSPRESALSPCLRKKKHSRRSLIRMSSGRSLSTNTTDSGCFSMEHSNPRTFISVTGTQLSRFLELLGMRLQFQKQKSKYPVLLQQIAN